ncbi:hypothetical protein RV14_GL002183 [Enterococcus ratti]|uniref:Uncharacterized protein n=1 Tax=Enterococcus ratti TaxID=150033 RepID=A0A1L8WPE7_9ENTE|nr:hypothetical protein RV14_GL002183 [Enterococcus ratti]
MNSMNKYEQVNDGAYYLFLVFKHDKMKTFTNVRGKEFKK